MDANRLPTETGKLRRISGSRAAAQLASGSRPTGAPTASAYQLRFAEAFVRVYVMRKQDDWATVGLRVHHVEDLHGAVAITVDWNTLIWPEKMDTPSDSTNEA